MGTITSVAWSQYAIGAPDATTGSHRVKLRGGGTNSTVTMFLSGTDYPTIPYSWSRQANPISSEILGGNTFKFAFWSVKVTHVGTNEVITYLTQGPSASFGVNASDADAQFVGEAHAYYVWVPTDSGSLGPSSPYVLIDAFDSALNDFIPDDPFVDVSTTSDPGLTNFISAPYPGDPLSAGANDLGYINTDATIPPGETVKITARDLPGQSGWRAKPFNYWLPITVMGAATVGQGNPHDIVAHHDDMVVAFAIYSEASGRTLTKAEIDVAKVEVEVPSKLNEGMGGVDRGDPGPDWLEALRRVDQQVSALTQQVADQGGRVDMLSRRFDAATSSIVAHSTRVEGLEKYSGQAFIRPEERPVVGEQVTAAPRRGFLARLFHRGA